MPSCRDIDPLFAPYIDGEATADQRALVDAHLRACPKCRHHTALQAAVRTTVREKLSRPCAPDALRARCRAAASIGTGPFGIPISRLKALSLAAALTLVIGGVLMYGLVGIPTVLAAQLTIDHVTCFAFRDADAPIDVAAGERDYAREYGRDIRLPRTADPQLQLVGVRRCYCGEGAAAHAMYRLGGRPLSLYVIPDARREQATVDAFGHDAVMWSNNEATYVLVARDSPEGLEAIAAQMRAGL
jgi:anti-sigma factor RsiW